VKRLCNARLRCKPGRRCRKSATAEQLRCRLHGGVAGNGKHLSEDARHSVSLGKASRAQGPLFPLDHSAGGRVRARQAIRATDGRFLPGRLHPPHPDAHVRKALRIIEVRMEKNARLQVVPADSDADDIAPEPRGAPLEAQAAMPEPPAAAGELGTEAPPESPPSAEELLEALIVVLLDDEPDEDEGPSLWSLVTDAMPPELYAQIGDWLDERWK